MIEKPMHGWSCLKIDKFEKQCSYLTDPVSEIADLLENAMHHKNGIAHFEAEEEGSYDLIFSNNNFYIVDRGNNIEVIDLDNISLPELVTEFINDIKINIDAWIDWEGYIDEDEMNALRKENEIRIKNAINQLKTTYHNTYGENN